MKIRSIKIQQNASFHRTQNCNEIQPVSLLTVNVGSLPTQTAVQDPAAVAAQAAMWVVWDVETPEEEKNGIK